MFEDGIRRERKRGVEKDDGEGERDTDCRKCNKRVSPPHLGSAPLCAVSQSHSQSSSGRRGRNVSVSRHIRHGQCRGHLTDVLEENIAM